MSSIDGLNAFVELSEILDEGMLELEKLLILLNFRPMRPLSQNDIESEISYAYLHAVASHAGAGCSNANRASDGNGIDAIITAWGPFPGGGYLQEIDIKIQLKATKGIPPINNGFISYTLNGISRYDDLRSNALATNRLLVVLFLPQDSADWLSISENELMLRNARTGSVSRELRLRRIQRDRLFIFRLPRYST